MKAIKILSCSFFLSVMVISTVRGNEETQELSKPDSIKTVVFTDIYLDGGTTVLFGETVGNKIFYLHASGIADGKDILLWDRRNLFNEPNLFIELLNGLRLWSLRTLNGKDPVETFRLNTSGENTNQEALNAVLVFGFVEEVCASMKLIPISHTISNSKVCKFF